MKNGERNAVARYFLCGSLTLHACFSWPEKA